MQTFAETLHHYRTEAGLSQSRLAEDAGFDHSYVSRLEAGNRLPSRSSVTALAQALRLDGDNYASFLESAGFVVDDLTLIVRREWGLVKLARLLADPDIDPTYAEMARSQVDVAVTLLEQNAAAWRLVEEREAS